MITTKLELRAFVSFNLVILSVIGQNLLKCDTTSQPEYICDVKKPPQNCSTYAILRANSHYYSLSNLSSYLVSISPSEIIEANGFSNDSEFFSNEQPILIPIECKCSNGGFFEAEVKRSTTKGENFYEIADSLEGLTTCSAITEKNPSVSPWNLEEKINLLIPLKCACPSSLDSSNFLLSYPVREGDTLLELASKFNVSEEALVSANNRHSRSGFGQDNNKSLVPLSTLLIPSKDKPGFGFSGQPSSSSVQVRDSHSKRRKRKMWMIGVYIAIGIIALLACIAIWAAFVFIQMKRKRDDPTENRDLELQQLSLSVRTTSDKKVSFEGSQCNFDDPTREAITPHKTKVVESYTFEDLQKATEDFNSSNLIEGSVYHGRLKGKNLAIKRIPFDTMAKIDQHICYERIHHHPNTIRMLGTCLREDCHDSYIVFEYAKNGSLKDWIHGGLAIKSHFIASCSCFLTWNLRIKICLDVATALQYMHHIMNPSYIHSNIRSRNIFLDEDFSAKVGNFGMSKCVENEAEDQESSNKGYLAPEYIDRGEISPSTDVFAFGVIMLEVLSGNPPLKRDEDKGDSVKLCDEIKRILESEDAEELRGWIDGALGENYSFDGAVMLANLARSCVEEEPCSRPNAGEIVEKLLRLVEELPEGDQLSSICESSCKPLVDSNAAAKGM